MTYYAELDNNDVVMSVFEIDSTLEENNLIEISSYDQTLVGKWYNRTTQQFMDIANLYLEKVKSVDGAGSGLDADKLDGLEASAFALADHVHEGMSVGEHDHDDEYAPINHTHSEYALANHTHEGSSVDETNLVHLTGAENITGAKTFTANPTVNKDNANLVLKVSNLTKGTKSTAASYDGVAVMDKDGSALANMRYCQDTDGNGYLQFKAFDYTGDASDYVDLRLYKPAGATAYAQLPNLVKLRSGNQAIYETSDFMIFGTGNKPTLIACKSDSPVTVNGVRMDVPSLVPRNTNTHGIGLSGQRFTNCYLVNSPNVSSDRRLKENIEDVDADDMLGFIDALNVVNYNYIAEPETERIGLIAQDVEDAGGAKFVEVGEDGMYGLKTADLVYPLIGAVQALYSRVLELEAQLKN